MEPDEELSIVYCFTILLSPEVKITSTGIYQGWRTFFVHRESIISVPPLPPDIPPTPSSKTSSRSKRTSLKLAIAQQYQQQLLMVESCKLLEHLRKEVYKLRSQNLQLKSDFRSLQENTIDWWTQIPSVLPLRSRSAKQMLSWRLNYKRQRKC